MSEFSQVDSNSNSGIQEDKILTDFSDMKMSSKEDSDIQTENFLRYYKIITEYGKDCRYLAASEKFHELCGLFQYSVKKTSTSLDQDHDKAFLELPNVKRIVEEHRLSMEPIIQVIERSKEVLDAVHYQDDDTDWILGADMFGIKTWYKLDEDHTMILKLVGDFDELPVFELLSVIKEVDLFTEWVPFCKESCLVDEITHHELIPYIWLYSPLLGRDFCFHAYAADCMREHGRVIILGKSIDEYPVKPIPWKPKSWRQNRMIIKELKSTINILGPNRATNTFIIHVDPNTSLPQTLINFIMKNMAGVLLYWFQRQTLKVAKDHNCNHAQRIRQQTEFYRDWLLPKVREFCDEKGWEQPTIACLGPDGIPPAKKTDSKLKEEGK